MLRSRFILAVFAGLLCLTFFGCSAVALVRFFKQPETENLPIYPNAQAVQDTPLRQNGFAEERVTTFQTSDSVQDVKAFYRTAMVRDGWQARQEEHDHLVFIYNDCPFYYVYVVVRDHDSEQTTVELQLSKELCR